MIPPAARSASTRHPKPRIRCGSRRPRPTACPWSKPPCPPARATSSRSTSRSSPGDTTFEVSYRLPFSSPGSFSGRAVQKDAPLRLAVPAGVTLKGEGLELLGQEPQSKASIYSVKTADYKVEIAGHRVDGRCPRRGSRRHRLRPGSDPSQGLRQRLPHSRAGARHSGPRLYSALSEEGNRLPLRASNPPRRGAGIADERGRRRGRLEVLRRLSRPARHQPARRAGRLPGPARPERRGQDHAAENPGRALQTRAAAGSASSTGVPRPGHPPQDRRPGPRHRRLRGVLGSTRTCGCSPGSTACPIPARPRSSGWNAPASSGSRTAWCASSRAACASGWRWPAPFCTSLSVLLLDEPFTALDDRAIAVLQELLAEARAARAHHHPVHAPVARGPGTGHPRRPDQPRPAGLHRGADPADAGRHRVALPELREERAEGIGRAR